MGLNKEQIEDRLLEARDNAFRTLPIWHGFEVQQVPAFDHDKDSTVVVTNEVFIHEATSEAETYGALYGAVVGLIVGIYNEFFNSAFWGLDFTIEHIAKLHMPTRSNGLRDVRMLWVPHATWNRIVDNQEVLSARYRPATTMAPSVLGCFGDLEMGSLQFMLPPVVRDTLPTCCIAIDKDAQLRHTRMFYSLTSKDDGHHVKLSIEFAYDEMDVSRLEFLDFDASPDTADLSRKFHEACMRLEYHEPDAYHFERNEYTEDCVQIRARLACVGVTASLRDCACFWSWFSHKMDASWLVIGCLPSDLKYHVKEFVA